MTFRKRATTRLALLLLTAAAVMVSPRAALAYTCPLAPRHGSLCKYTDPGLFKSLIANSQAELMRLGAVNASVPLMKAITQATGRNSAATVQYEALLQLVTRPRVPVPRAFAASWTLIHPDAQVRVRYANGTTEVVNVAEEVQRYMQAASAAATRDPLGVMAGQVASLAAANGEAGTAEYAGVLNRVGLSGRSAIVAGAGLAQNANDLASTVRSGPDGMAGQSRAEILGAKAGVDQSKGVQSALRLDAAEEVVRAAKAASRAREARNRVIQDILGPGNE
ncbi:MAG: hypothetical protein ACR2M1_09655 [Gemmatimonadaceae bacterium]